MARLGNEGYSMKKLRVGRIVITLLVILSLYFFVSWFLSNKARVNSISQDMNKMSLQLSKQKEQIDYLSSSLNKLSTDLKNINSNINSLHHRLQDQSQVIEFSLEEISNNIINMKSKIDVLSSQGNRGYYR